MNISFFEKILKWLNSKSKTIAAICAVIMIFIILIGIINYQSQKIKSLKKDIIDGKNLTEALLDSMIVYQNKEKEWVAEKKTIQIKLDELVKINYLLNDNQKELLKRILALEKQNTVIAAALIKTNVILDSLKSNKVEIDTTNKAIVFSDSTKNLVYRIIATPVIPADKTIKPNLIFEKFLLPNTQFVEFHWENNKKKGYPVSFSVTNTNEYFKTINIDSYVIPFEKPQKTKFGEWIKKNGKIITYVGAGIVTGGLGVYLVSK